jgi:hypothetical protein
MSDFGAWTVECSRGFTPAELAEAVVPASEHVELRYVGALSRAQGGFVAAASAARWVHLTLWDPVETGLVLTFERDNGSAPPPFVAKVEAEIATERFSDDAERRAAAGALAERVVELACEKLGMKITGHEAASPGTEG